MSLPTYSATRYVLPLREGGSLPAVLDTDGGMFVAKFRGAGQGAKALIAEIIVTLIAKRLGLPVPEIALIELDPSFGRTERDPEIQDLLKASAGLNVGYRYLEGAFSYDPLATPEFAPQDLATRIVWLDALTTNIDRTPRNPNLLIWQGGLYLIDHGAALYFHHNWASMDDSRALSPFPQIKDHVLLPLAGDVEEADDALAALLGKSVVDTILAEIPAALLMDTVEGREPPFTTPEENRAAYMHYFMSRLAGPRAFAQEAERARAALGTSRPNILGYRR